MRKFNVTGLCVPEEDYMVDISGKVEQIIKLIDSRSYFTINRARQYGKTTTLACLENALKNRYLVASISFEGLSEKKFESPEAFCPMFLKKIAKSLEFTSAPKQYVQEWINNEITGVLQQDVVRDGKFDLELCLLKFAEHYAEIFGGCDLKFIEKKGRLLFLLYLRPLINGKGFYHIESQFTDLRRMDIVVDFGRDQFIIELKIWNGNSRHQEAYDQLLGYMENKKALNGYLLTFDFRKEANKQRRAKWVDFEGGKRIFDVVL
ncbi:MAG: hypothetical protein FWF85_01610 [Clostridiales bacterium]|nr:hypothetical protein [Clostridiales bacterium]